MTVNEMIIRLQKCNPEATITIIQEETLECMPEWWDEEKQKVGGRAIEVFSEDLYSHRVYLLAVGKG